MPFNQLANKSDPVFNREELNIYNAINQLERQIKQPVEELDQNVGETECVLPQYFAFGQVHEGLTNLWGTWIIPITIPLLFKVRNFVVWFTQSDPLPKQKFGIYNSEGNLIATTALIGVSMTGSGSAGVPSFIPINIDLTPGQYYIGIGIATDSDTQIKFTRGPQNLWRLPRNGRVGGVLPGNIQFSSIQINPFGDVPMIFLTSGWVVGV